MGCIYNGVCSSLVALFLRQQVTNLAAVMVHQFNRNISLSQLFLPPPPFLQSPVLFFYLTGPEGDPVVILHPFLLLPFIQLLSPDADCYWTQVLVHSKVVLVFCRTGEERPDMNNQTN